MISHKQFFQHPVSFGSHYLTSAMRNLKAISYLQKVSIEFY